MDEAYDSPFTVEARKNGYDVEWWEKAQGKLLVGKMDDIAVVVAFLAEKEKCRPRRGHGSRRRRGGGGRRTTRDRAVSRLRRRVVATLRRQTFAIGERA